MNDVTPKRRKTLGSNLDSIDNLSFDLTVEKAGADSVSSELSQNSSLYSGSKLCSQYFKSMLVSHK